MAKEQATATKILIVEDYAVLARMYQDKLRADGFEVEVALDGEQGEKLVREFKPTLVLLDVMLPKKNGLEILESIKKDPQTAGTSVIMLTNLGGPPETIAKALELGADNYLVKANYTPKQVIEEAKKVLRERAENPIKIPGVKEEAPSPPVPPPPSAPPTPTSVGATEKDGEKVKEDEREVAREEMRKAAMLLEMAQKQAEEAAKKLTELGKEEK